jgi:hypothetical protein
MYATLAVDRRRLPLIVQPERTLRLRVSTDADDTGHFASLIVTVDQQGDGSLVFVVEERTSAAPGQEAPRVERARGTIPSSFPPRRADAAERP